MHDEATQVDENSPRGENLQLLTSQDVCARLRITPGTLGRWKKLGVLVPVMLPAFARGHRFRSADVLKLIEAK